MRTILFVCSGNTCRSPMAEAVTRHWLAEGHLPGSGEMFVASAGTFAMEGLPVTMETLEALSTMGIEHTGSSKMLTADMIRNADVVFAMTEAHVVSAAGLVGDEVEHREKIQRLDPEDDLEDPIGMGQSAYDELARRLKDLIPARLTEVMVS